MSREEANRLGRAAERLRRSRHLGLKLGLPTAAAFGAGAALAVGAIPGTDGTITGCYITNPDGARYGELRIIDPSQPATLPGGGPNQRGACLGDERTITWNQRGPQGPAGAQGAQGPPGAAGAQGANGANGAPLIGQTTFGFSGAGKTFLKLDGIKGESLDKTHKDEIEVESFSFSATSSGNGGGSGAAVGKTISSFTITKKLDKASPALFQAAANGKHIKLADVSFERKAGRGQQEFLVIKLQDVLISSVQQGSGGGGAKEQVTFAFHKATETFLGADHKALQTVTIDVGANKKA